MEQPVYRRPLKLPIAFHIIIQRLGRCLKCGHMDRFIRWKWGFYAFHCPKCNWKADVKGAVRLSTWERADPM